MASSIRPSRIEPITLRRLEVLDAFDISATMRRIVLGGSELRGVSSGGFDAPPLISAGFDDEIKLFFPHPVTGVLTLPIQRDRVIEWPRDPRPLARTYTVRSVDTERGRLELDFVIHGTGLASTWARTCEPGDVMHIAGPKMSLLQPVGADWLLIAGDETAIPAISRWIEELPTGVVAEVVIEVGGPADEQRLESGPDVHITWVHRGSAEAGTTTHLADAVRSVPWHRGTPFAWVAGETLSVKPIRRWLREERGLAPDRVEVTGYWRRTLAAPQAEVDGLSDPETAVDDGERFHELADPLPSRAIRVAATLRLVPLVLGGESTVERLVLRTGADRVGLGKLVRYLSTIGILDVAVDGCLTVTSVGRELDDEDTAAALDLRHPLGGLVGAFDDLLGVVETGRPARSAAGLLTGDGDGIDRIAAFEEEAVIELEWLRPAFAREYRFAAGETVTVVGAGGATLLLEALASENIPRVTLLVPPERERAAADLLPDSARRRLTMHTIGPAADWPRARTTLLAGALRTLPDAAAVALLLRATSATEPGGRVLIVEHLLVPEEIDDHEAAEDLHLLSLHGSGFRSRDEVLDLVDLAGLEVSRERVIGWGEPVFEIDVS